MLKLALLLALAACTCLASADRASAQTNTPRTYIMMQNGKLTEVINGKKEAVKQDITLVNGTTIHPDGKINDRDGNWKQLQEGEYMTMDGKIRKLKDMGGKPTPAQ